MFHLSYIQNGPKLQPQELQDIIPLHLNEPENQILADHVNHLRSLSEENEAYFQSVKKIWEAAAETKRLGQVDVNKSLGDFKTRLNSQSLFTPRKRFGWLSLAAALFVVAMGGWIYYQTTKTIYIMKEAMAKIDSVVLSDGSKIILATNSAIRYPEKFSKNDRPVTLLKGQAFFSVAKDALRPFEITIKSSTVKVLGTSFNILYADSTINLSVKTGKVLFTPNSKSEPSLLTAGEGLSYNFSRNFIVSQNADNASAWLTKELRFVDMPLDEVCKQLSDYYAVTIILHDEMRNKKKFNANFKDISLEEALIVLKNTYAIKVELQGKTIVIKSL